jgi:hypothetical protein
MTMNPIMSMAKTIKNAIIVQYMKAMPKKAPPREPTFKKTIEITNIAAGMIHSANNNL